MAAVTTDARKRLSTSDPVHSKFDQALLALGRLDSISSLLPDTSLFLSMYIRKEAVLSSMIEGTQSSLSDLLLYELDETPNVPLNDVRRSGNWEAWLDFFAEAIIVTADQAVETTQQLLDLSTRHRDRNMTGHHLSHRPAKMDVGPIRMERFAHD